MWQSAGWEKFNAQWKRNVRIRFRKNKQTKMWKFLFKTQIRKKEAVLQYWFMTTRCQHTCRAHRWDAVSPWLKIESSDIQHPSFQATSDQKFRYSNNFILSSRVGFEPSLLLSYWFHSCHLILFSCTPTVQNERWGRLRTEGTSCISPGGPDAGHHAAGQGNNSRTWTRTRAHTKFPRDFLTSNVGVTSLKHI